MYVVIERVEHRTSTLANRVKVMATNTFRSLVVAALIAAPVLLPTTVPEASAQPAETVEAARAALDLLYKGDYRRAFVEKKPELFGRHIAPELQYSSYDGSTATGEQLKQIVAGRIATIERVLDHSVSIEHVEIDDAGRIVAVVTLTTVLDIRSQANRVYREISVGTYRDTFVQQADDSLLEVRAQLMRSHTTISIKP
jgi:hypothetical protein